MRWADFCQRYPIWKSFVDIDAWVVLALQSVLSEVLYLLLWSKLNYTMFFFPESM